MARQLYKRKRLREVLRGSCVVLSHAFFNCSNKKSYFCLSLVCEKMGLSFYQMFHVDDNFLSSNIYLFTYNTFTKETKQASNKHCLQKMTIKQGLQCCKTILFQYQRIELYHQIISLRYIDMANYFKFRFNSSNEF